MFGVLVPSCTFESKARKHISASEFGLYGESKLLSAVPFPLPLQLTSHRPKRSRHASVPYNTIRTISAFPSHISFPAHQISAAKATLFLLAMSRCYFPEESSPTSVSAQIELLSRLIKPETAPPRTLSGTNPNNLNINQLSHAQSHQIKKDLREWIREKAYRDGFLPASGRFMGQIRLYNVLCSSLTTKMIRIGIDESDVREEFQQLIDKGLIDGLMREQSRRAGGGIPRPRSSSGLLVDPDDPAVVMWIKRTAKEVAFWDKSGNGFLKGEFIGELRLYTRLLDRLPDLRTKIKPPAYGGNHSHQNITKTLVEMISQGYLEELEAEGRLRRNQSLRDAMFDQESVGMSDESNSSARASRGIHSEQSSFSMGREAEDSPMFDNIREVAQEEATTDYRNIFRSVHSNPGRDSPDAPKITADTSASLAATNTPSCSEYSARLREIYAESIAIPDLRALPPISIPANIQHPILQSLQCNLEIAFFEYAQKHYPTFLLSNNLTHAHAATLTIWTAKFHEACTTGTISLCTQDLRSITAVFEELDELCEASVKHLTLDGGRLAELTASAAYAMKYLGDRFRAGKVNEVSLALVAACTDDIASSFTRITGGLRDTVEGVARERERLDMLEEKAKRRSDGEMKELVGRLEGALHQELGSLGILGSARAAV
ncbi:hypothetical protein DFP73DRAFT_583242 [Morchella snyderi]|nr:hypothetical protein DFP73DRAFT_583242 [Morchella snyderi]